MTSQIMKKFFKYIKFIIIIVLVILIGGITITKCSNCKKENETAVAFAAEEDIKLLSSKAASNSIDFKGSLLSVPYYHYDDVLSTDGGNVLLYLNLFDYPINQSFTVEIINNNFNAFYIQFLGNDSWDNVLFSGQFDKSFYITLNQNDLVKIDYISIHIGRGSSIQDIQLNLDFYFYAGEYVPGYGQGLAAGLQQGYQNGYNQGTAETAKNYSLGVFKNSIYQFAYENNSSNLTINSFINDLGIDYNGAVYFTDYPYLSSNYKYYYLYVSFDSPFILNTNTFYFNFISKMGNDGFARIDFWNSEVNSVSDNLESSSFVLAQQVNQDKENIYMVSSLNASLFGKTYNKMLIRTEGADAYNYLQSLKISTIATGESSYYIGYDKGYNNGYSDGEEFGFNTGYENGTRITEELKQQIHDTAFKEGESQGYANAVSEGASAMGLFTGAVSFVKVFFQLLTKLLETKIAGDISMGLLVIGLPAAFMIVNLAIGLVKKLLGARGASEGGDDS